MKIKIKILFIMVLVITSLTLLLLLKNERHIEQMEYSKLPNISLIEYNKNVTYNLFDFTLLNKTVVMFISPDCSHCEKEIGDIISYKEEFKDVRWLFITQSILKDELKSFLYKYPIMSIPNAVILMEDWSKYYTMFEVSAPPAIFVYNKKGELINSERGEVGIDVIREWLR